jgi:hypothetical protein
MATTVPVGQYKLTIAAPRRAEVVVLALFITFLMWWDVLNNQILSYGLGHRVTWFGDITTLAIDLASIMIFLTHVALLTLFIMSLKSKSTSASLDIVVGALALFGVAILLGGFINGLYSGNIRFFFMTMSSISFYHIGVGLEFIAAFYYAFTK